MCSLHLQSVQIGQSVERLTFQHGYTVVLQNERFQIAQVLEYSRSDRTNGIIREVEENGEPDVVSKISVQHVRQIVVCEVKLSVGILHLVDVFNGHQTQTWKIQ